MIKEAIIKVAKKEDLTYEESKAVMNEIMDGETSQVQTAAYLTALAMKGETIDEITGSAEGMRSHALQLKHDMDVLEIVGTGGDGSNSFNISTTASLVIAAGGVPVAKHGNRAASSKSGAADVLEALGVKITLTPEQSEKILEKIGICFLFAQTYHTAMKFVAPVRKELGIRTVFNILGPLTNPANANMQIMGVYSKELVEPMAQALAKLGVKKGMVVYGTDSLDEITLSAPTDVCEICDGKLASYEIVPEQFGYKKCEKDELKGGTPQENAAITRAILDGSERGAKRQAVCMNAGAALHVAGKAETMEEGVRLAEQLIDSGAALKKLEAFIQESNELSRLTIFVSHIMVFHIMSDIPEMDCYRFADIYFPQCCPQFFRKVAGIPIRSVCGSETRHRNCGDLFSRHAEEIKCSGCYQQCQCGIESSGDTDDRTLAVSVFQTFLQSHRLDRQDLVTAFFTLFFS